MKRTINAEFEDINQACSFYNEAIKDTQKECDLTLKNSQPLIIITDKEKEEDKGKVACPECKKKTLSMQGGCNVCTNCGYTKCD